MLTVGELRKAIDGVDSDYEVYVYDRLYGFPNLASTIKVAVEADYKEGVCYQRRSVTIA
jgi:hypothetical protein